MSSMIFTETVMAVCPRCGKHMSSSQALEYHLKKRKPCNAPNSCPKCNSVFDTSVELWEHKQVCKLAPNTLRKIVQSHSSDNIYVLDLNLCILAGNDSSLIGRKYIKTIVTPLQKNVELHIRSQEVERMLTKKRHSGHAVFISSFPCNNTYIVFETIFSPRNKCPGFLTPP